MAVCMTVKSDDGMIARYRAQVEQHARERLAEAGDLIAAFTSMAASKGINLGTQSFEYIQAIGIVATAPGIARTLLGPLGTERDGVLPFEDIASRFPPKPHYEGCFVGAEFVLMATPYFRRGMHSACNWAPRFIELFWRCNEPYVQRFIALDEDRVRIDVNGPIYFESDTWFGAPFDENIRNIKSGIIKLRPPLDIESWQNSFFFADAYCLDIKWSQDDRIKSFQALEIKTADVRVEVDGLHYFPARYLHAEFDVAANCFRHFDGAIQLFTEEEYFQRRDADFNMSMKNVAHIKARSKKIFKINGSLKTENWVELCCHFYTGNPLIFEYFSGEYPIHVTEALERLKASASDPD
jgi:hypothetical protein